MSPNTPAESGRKPLDRETLDGLREMAGTVAVKGPLLLALLDEIDASRAAPPSARESGEALCNYPACVEGSNDIDECPKCHKPIGRPAPPKASAGSEEAAGVTTERVIGLRKQLSHMAHGDSIDENDERAAFHSDLKEICSELLRLRASPAPAVGQGLTGEELEAIHAGANALAGKSSLNAANEERWHKQCLTLRNLAARGRDGK